MCLNKIPPHLLNLSLIALQDGVWLIWGIHICLVFRRFCINKVLSTEYHSCQKNEILDVDVKSVTSVWHECSTKRCAHKCSNGSNSSRNLLKGKYCLSVLWDKKRPGRGRCAIPSTFIKQVHFKQKTVLKMLGCITVFNPVCLHNTLIARKL